MVLTEAMKPIKQLSLAETGFLPKAGKQTRKAIFLAEMQAAVPWSRPEALIEPHYPKKGGLSADAARYDAADSFPAAMV